MREWFESLAPRERVFVAAGSVIAIVGIIYGLLLAPLFGASAAAETRIAGKTADLARIQGAAAQLGKLGDAPAARSSSGQSLVVVVANSAGRAGLGDALSRNQPVGNDGIRVRFENASFDALARWVIGIQSSEGLAIDSASFDRSRDPGRVNASLILRRSEA
jgi:type II secretory pathway component PulM